MHVQFSNSQVKVMGQTEKCSRTYSFYVALCTLGWQFSFLKFSLKYKPAIRIAIEQSLQEYTLQLTQKCPTSWLPVILRTKECSW